MLRSIIHTNALYSTACLNENPNYIHQKLINIAYNSKFITRAGCSDEVRKTMENNKF